ncbi:hypothetical protein JN531_012745 [Flagellatimonas centrodinii]|uniref:hypothetical protein n=1 Tax=Flagellatimonas centrodinii TaxID=2806210 RepID=UPI001FEEB0A3|nr:hypothetical protein [Flagellatimonas centrodinii]ULQ45968.1 hypothetical protein JN531_012745 [Flagellatimonas centrodinii]
MSSTIELLDPRAIADWLQPTLLALGWSRVDVAVTLQPDPELTDTPALYVVPLKDKALSAESGYGTTLTQQDIEGQIGLQIVCPSSELIQRRREAASATHGKTLPGTRSVAHFVEGEVLALDRSKTWWVDVYATRTYWRSTP